MTVSICKIINHTIDIPESVRTVCSAFRKARKRVFVVGGCVRDSLLGVMPKDWDVATPCKPDEVKAILSQYKDEKHNYGIHYFSKGEAFGVISAMPWVGNHESSKGRHAVEVEIATFRKDLGEGRRPENVEFCDLENDVQRRDLTINALYYDPYKRSIFDYVGGFQDISNRRIRCVGDPMDRFREDPLRVMRFIRFFCRFTPSSWSYEKHVDEVHRNAIEAYAKTGLKGVSPERIRQEFISGIKQANVDFFVHTLNKANLLSTTVFPGCKINLNTLNSRTTELLLASILHENGSDKLRKILNELKYSTHECKTAYFYTKFAEEFRPEKLEKDREIPYRLKKFQNNRRINVGNNLIFWADTIGLKKDLVDAFMYWHLSESASEVPGTSKLKGKEIGDRMKEYDVNNFWDLTRSSGEYF